VKLDLTPFGFTPTESLVYATLLRLGPATGYAVARGARLARANAYGALEGLVTRGAATRTPPPTRPARYRPIDPQALIAQLATLQGEALDRLGRELRGFSRPGDPVTREVAGSRAVANLVMQLVARAERRVEGVVALELWRPTLPAWRRAGERAQMDVRMAGDLPEDAPPWLGAARDDPSTPSATVLVIDEAQLVATAGAGESIAGLWTSHPVIVMLARRALQTIA
jgi:sugar-specific transcriptional regulator TrmB